MTPVQELTQSRNMMVDGQLRPSKVNDRRLLAIMRRLPREDFVPQAMREFAYIDQDVRLSPSRVMMKPLVLARLIQLAAPRPGETALVVGASSGYGAAVLAELGAQVTALEEDEDLIALGREAMIGARAAERTPVSSVTGRLIEGFAERAPYDLIVIEGAVQAIPERIGRQVAQHGRLVAVLSTPGAASVAVLAEPSLGGLRAKPAFDASAALLPGLLPAPSFAF